MDTAEVTASDLQKSGSDVKSSIDTHLPVDFMSEQFL